MSCGNELKPPHELKPPQNRKGLLFSSEQAAEIGILSKAALVSHHIEIIPSSFKI